MNVAVVTLFPELFTSVLATSLLGKAIARGDIGVNFVDPRDFSVDKHRSVDDTPYGGGVGMVLRPEPLVAAIEHAGRAGEGRRILLCPSGAPLTQPMVRRLASEPRLTLICGRYEGFDERIRAHVDEEISLGDFVLSGGEIAALAIIDAVSRHLPGVLGNAASTVDESHEAGLLEYPQYTRPADFRGVPVPPVLVGGNHEAIRLWRRREALRRTRDRRPDLLAAAVLSDEDKKLMAELDT